MTTPRPRRLAPAVLALLLGITACSSDTGDEAGPGTTDLDSDQIELTSALETFDSCDALLDRIKDEALERVGPYGFGQGGPIWLEGEALDDAATADVDVAESAPAPADGGLASDRVAQGEAATAQATEADQAAGDGAGFSGTNNQEEEVDEADLVKTDGQRLVVVAGNRLQIIDVSGDEPELTDTVELPDEAWGGQLFLAGDEALLMTSGWTDRPFVERGGPATDIAYPGSPTAKILSIDLTNGEITRTIEFEGAYLSAREVDGSVRVVLSANADRFAFVYPSNEDATDSAEEANRRLIEESTIDQWLPTYRIVEGTGTGDDVVTEGPMVDCEQVHVPAEFAGFGSLVMLTADAGDGFELNDATAVFTDAQTVYASTDRVAVATPRWARWNADGTIDDDGDDYSTAIHTFDITDPDTASYVASGSVRGHLLNQYSLSEHDGHLRVATTDGAPWGGSDSSESFVTVLDEDGGRLTQVGQVGGLGKGEQIQAVRFLGDTGYVVTFRQVDPLYVVDLSEPTDPRVAGELKIPGFSSYLHPLDDDQLLGVGTDGDDDGNLFGAAISLFDVSDPTDPTLVTKLNFDEAADRATGSSSTAVSWDAKAFTYWDGVAMVPVDWWSYGQGIDQNGSELVQVGVDPASGSLTELGRVSHPSEKQCEGGGIPQPLEEPTPDIGEEPTTTVPQTDDAEASFVDPPSTVMPVEPDGGPGGPVGPDQFCFSWAPQITRSVVIGDDLYTVSDAGVQVNRFDGLDEVAWISFR